MSTNQYILVMSKLDAGIKTVIANKTILESASESIKEIRDHFILQNAQRYGDAIEILIDSGRYELRPNC